MNLKSNYLTLSMKEQICFAIVLLTAFSILVILSLVCTFCYEIFKEDYKQKKLYFYDKFKEYIEVCFYFQNFCLLQYEEIIKRLQLQVSKFQRNSTTFYNLTTNFGISTAANYVQDFNPEIHKNISENNDYLFFFCYNENKYICQQMKLQSIYLYTSLDSLIFSHDIYKSFNIPGYGVSLIDSLLIVDVYANISLSFNGTKLYKSILDLNNNYAENYSNFNGIELYKYYDNIVRVMLNNNYIMMGYYFLSKLLFQFDDMFEKVVIELSTIEEASIIDINNNSSFLEYAKSITGYYTSVKFPENKFSFINYNNNKFYYIESTMIENYLYSLHNKMAFYLDISFIPLNYENNTIISPELCILFLLKQINYDLDTDKINELYNNIKRGVSNITDCFFNKNIFKNQNEIEDVFILNCSHFLTVNNSIEQGIIDTGEQKYYYAKYTYPNYNVLKEFKSDYLFLDQINFYLFASFKDPEEYSNFVFIIYRNCFLLILILVIYIWIICLTVNLLIYVKIINQLTEPINKMQEAIESSSVKDESLFKYEYDDFINDLFITCKELLSGQIDKNNNENGLGQFNILSIPKDKQKNIDNNIYQRNLIINNDLMEQLIMEQQSMMDFSKNIQINELYDEYTNDNISLKKNKKKQQLNNDFALNSQENKKIENENISNKNTIKINKNNEVEDREPYRKLFQISEYLNYYQNKTEDNYVHIINNVINDESKKSNISKISNNMNVNGSLKITSKLKKKIVRGDSYGKPEDNDNIVINMLDNKDIGYLWYMEAKKKKNKSLNYHTNYNYDELFMDFNNYQNNHENIKRNDIVKDMNLH